MLGTGPNETAAHEVLLFQEAKTRPLTRVQAADKLLNLQFDTFLTFLTGVMLGLDPSIQAT